MEEQIDISTPMGKLLLTFLGGIAELELSTLKKRFSSGKVEKMYQGKYLNHHNLLYGYCYEEENLKIIPEEANIIYSVIKKIKDGSSVRACARYLTDNKIPSPTGKDFWYTVALRNILMNPLLKGYARYKGKLFKIKDMETILKEKEFDDLQRILIARTGPGGGNKKIAHADYIFLHLLRCECGGKYYAKQSRFPNKKTNIDRITKYYMCNNTKKNSKVDCHIRKMIRTDRMEAMFLDYLKTFSLPNPTQKKKEIKVVDEKKIKLLEKELDSLKLQKKNLTLHFLSEMFTAKEYSDLAITISNRTQEVESLIKKEKAKNVFVEEMNDTQKDKLKDFIKNVNDVWHTMTNEKKRTFALLHINEIVISDKIESITFLE